ncbi:MAG: protein adenylyltransferase SelO family protein, partial [Myxococcota bacterium]
MGRRDSLNSWGYEGNRHHIANAVLGDLAIEIDATKMKDGVRNTAKGTPYATAHNDGFGGAGDGRALVMAEREGRVLNMKGIGITPYVIQDFAIRLGFHALGGVDGRASLKEGIRTLATGDMLEVLGIPGERLAALIDNGGSASGGGETGRSAIIAREYPGAGIRNSHFRVWKDDPEQVGRGMAVLRELASKELGKPVSNRELVELEARRSGELAARLQHFKIAHGALTSGNILALPALIDLNTVRTMPVPDPNYSPFGRRFRYGEQPTALRKLVDERAKIYANHDPSVKGADIKGEFQKAFDKELAITTATRLGMTREKAELLYFARSEKLEPLSKEFWSLSMGYLKTDVEGMFRDMVAAQLQGGEFDVRAARSGYARDKSDIPDGYRANLQRASNAVTLRYSEAPVAGLERLQAKLAELLPAAVLVASEHKKELREVTKSEMVERAGLVANPQLPSVEQVDGLAAKVEEAVQRGEDVGPIVRQLDALLNPARMAMGKALPAANALITDTPATTKVETDYNAWVEA